MLLKLKLSFVRFMCAFNELVTRLFVSKYIVKIAGKQFWIDRHTPILYGIAALLLLSMAFNYMGLSILLGVIAVIVLVTVHYANELKQTIDTLQTITQKWLFLKEHADDNSIDKNYAEDIEKRFIIIKHKRYYNVLLIVFNPWVGLPLFFILTFVFKFVFN